MHGYTYFTDIALDLARSVKAPPQLFDLDDGTMLAVGTVPGTCPEEWRPVADGAWIGWPHAEGAAYAEEMTAAQLRAELARRDHG